MKKILFFLLALWVNSTAFAHDFGYGNLCYNIINVTDDTHKDVEVTYFGAGGEMYYSGDIEIPETFLEDGVLYTVKQIGFQAFKNCSNLTSVKIPSSVTIIGREAFVGYPLTSIEIPSSVTTIEDYAFGWSSLESIVIPSNVTSIDDGTFSNCYGLASVVIPEGVVSIGFCAFYDCDGLTSIEIPSSVTSINTGAFYACSGLTSIEIPSSVTSIGDEAFDGCSSLTSVEIPSSVTRLGEKAFARCSSLESVTFEEGNSSPLNIYPYAFQDCPNLKRVEFPSNLTRYGFDPETTFGMFEGCGQLTYVKMPFLYNTYPSTLFGKGDQYKNCYFEIPEGQAAQFINYGYCNISDLSQIGWMRGVFAGERDDIEAFAGGLADGAAKDELNAALELAQAKVDTMTSYVAIMGQIDAIKAAVMKFAGKVKLPNNTDVTSFVKNPRFDYESLGWDNVYTGDKIDSVLNAFVQTGATYENGEAKLDKFMERWTPMSHLENCKMEQTLTGLPAGHYRIEIDVLATTNFDSLKDVEGVWLVMNNQKIAVSTENNTPEHVTLDLEVLTAKDVKLGLHVENSNVRWIALDNFRLFYVDGMPPAPAASELVSSEDTVYLYNVETGAFLNVGNSYGTQAILAKQGAPLKLTQNGEGAWEVFFYEGSRNQKKLYLNEDHFAYTDYSDVGSASWQFTPAPEGGYLISNTEYDDFVLGNNPTRKDYNYQQGIELDTHNDVIMLDSQEGYCRWMVLSKEEGDKLMAMHQLYNAIARMRTSADLNEQLLANAESLYGQVDATYQEVKDMIVRLNSQLSMPKQGQPIDATYLIENPCFADNTPDGWLGATITSGVADNTQYETVEFYNDDFHMSQRIVGLPNGVYRLKYKGFHRPGYWEDVMDEYFGSATDNASAIVYANAAEKTLKNICTGAVETPLGTDGNLNMPENVGELGSYGKSIPNNQKATRAYFDAGYYVDSIDVEVTDNQLTIGVRNTEEMASHHWIILSDFELYVVENGKAAHNKLTIQDSKGISGGKTTLKIGMDNIDAIAGMQFDVQLPEGMTFSLDGSGRPKFTKSNRMNGMTVQSSMVGGNARVLVYALSDTVKGNSGNVINLEVNISNELANDDYEVKVINSVLTEPTALEIKPFDAVGTVTLVDAEIGDANKDGVVNVTDIISVANHILGDTPGSFDSFAADMNGDSVVNVTDIISIANLILGGGSADAKVRMTFELDPQ